MFEEILKGIMVPVNFYVLGMLFSIIIILVIDIADKKAGVINKYDKNEDIIVIILLLLSSWLSFLIVLFLILNSEKIRKISEKLNNIKK